MTDDREDRISESWVRNADSWTAAVREGRIASRRRVTDAAIVDAVLDCGGSRVLDVGCGEGWLARGLAARGLEVVGFDESAPLIERARELGGGSFHVLGYAELAQAPRALGSGFDVVVSNFSLLGERIDGLLLALAGITAPGGRLVIQTVHPATVQERPGEDGWRVETFEPLAPLPFVRMPWYFRTLDTWRTVLRTNGWARVEVLEPVDPGTGTAASLILVAEPGAGRAAAAGLTLRPATLADLPLLRHWDEQPHVRAATGDDGWGWEAELARSPDWREQLIAELDGRPIGFIQIIDPAREETRYWGDVADDLMAIDIWIGEPDMLGQGHGTRMMRLALDRCFADARVAAVIIDPMASNTRAHRFYERFGFRFVERRWFGDDECLVYRLSREDWAAARAEPR